jgi:hypothetical protein
MFHVAFRWQFVKNLCVPRVMSQLPEQWWPLYSILIITDVKMCQVSYVSTLIQNPLKFSGFQSSGIQKLWKNWSLLTGDHDPCWPWWSYPG